MNVGKSMIAAQLYTVREFMKTPADMAVSLKKVKQIGYDAVQLSGHGPIDTKELKKMLDGEGLEVCATHTKFETMQQETQKVIDDHLLLGCKYPAIGGLPANYRNRDGYAVFAKAASEVGAKFKAAGLTFGYHNHSFELEKFDGRLALDIIYEESDPRYVAAEIDTYWIQHGGGDPAAWIKKLSGRIPLVHLKDMGIIDGKPAMFEVGEGNMNWDSILQACKEAGTEWYIVEQDTCQRDPFESLAISLRNLRAMGLK